MSVSFQILPEYGIVYVRYEGFVRLEDTFRAFGEYLEHPQARAGQKHLVDLARVTGVESNFAKMMELQAFKADGFIQNGAETLIVYYAPTKLSYEISSFILRSWEGIDAVVPLVQESEAQALALLGLSQSSFAALLEGTG
ncbi:hypothetical protein M4578_17790 [Salipiger sp. P9]|uniref:hypothetical protein n=1 Tax=Salipiger pentaromativorans TaxID=2943193 RepID=UPI002157E477|nr:hypothetical protein [Salipiger pentaromativorans]MCR8549685.1 hypothetical protein [Salipiger pentaromativorans]